MLCALFLLLIPIDSPGIPDPPDREILRLETYTQPNVFLCGPTVIYLLLDYWGLENTHFKKLSSRIFSPSIMGTPNSSMVFCTEGFGLTSYSFSGSKMVLKELIKKGIPVIVLQNLRKNLKVGHFRIVVGMDTVRQNHVVYVKDPAEKRIKKMNWNRFESLWKRGRSINNNRWSMVILPTFIEPDIDEIRDSPLTELNKGSYFYRKFDYVRACVYFKKAFEKSRDNPDVLQYYAQGLIRLKRYTLASEMVERLLNLDSHNPIAYDLKALIHFYRGEHRQSLVAIEKAVKFNKKNRDNSFIDEHYQQIRRFVMEKEKE